MRLNQLVLAAAAALPLFAAPLAAQSDRPAKAPTSAEIDAPVAAEFTFDVPAPEFGPVQSRAARGRLKAAWKTYGLAVKRHGRAQKETSRTKSARLFQRAAAGFDKALLGLERLQARYGQDAGVRLAMKRLLPQFRQATRVAHLDLASAYASRGTFKQALDAIDRVLRDHPRDDEALRLRTHVQLLLAASFR